MRTYLHVLWRRKWAVTAAVALVTLASVLMSVRQEPLYQASADVLLSRENLAASLAGTPDLAASQDPDRFAQTQASIARVPAVVRRVIRAEAPELTVDQFLRASSVAAKPQTDLLAFTVTDSDPGRAARLATAYAHEYTVYRRKLDTATIQQARSALQRRIADLEDAGERRSALYAKLVGDEQQLSTLEALQTSNASVIQPATKAEQIQPKLVRNAVLALLLGGILGVTLAFLWEAIDTRVRSVDEISERLGLPLLARLPAPTRRGRNGGQVAMLADPSGFHAEMFRMLRTNLEFVNLDRGAKTIMVTSAVRAEGKSTTIANLAVAFARAGRRVVLVDLDLRRPMIDRFFGLQGRVGLTDVALGHAELKDALVPIAVASAERPRADDNGGATPVDLLQVLPSGPIPPNAGEFVGSRALATILDRVSEDADLVLIDAPPMLQVGDAMTLSAQVDALFLVVRANVIRRSMLDEVQRALQTCPAVRLGFCLTGADLEGGYGYGYYRDDARAATAKRRKQRGEPRRRDEVGARR